MDREELKRICEAVLFASDKPMSAEELAQAFDRERPGLEEITEALTALKEECRTGDGGVLLVEVAGGYQWVTNPRLSEYLKKFYEEREKKKLPQATLETLSIIAYKQPVARADIEFIRGVNVDGALKSLLEKGLVKIVSRREAPGRPMLYGTTPEFLQRFGLKSLKELPALAEFNPKDLDARLGISEATSVDSAELADGEETESTRER